MYLWKFSVNDQYTLIEQSSYDKDYDYTSLPFANAL